jgi:type I restriction enzyme S subunit
MLRLPTENTLDREEKTMAEWISKTLGELTSFISKGIPPKYVDEENENTIRVLNQKCNRNFEISYNESRIHNAAVKKVPENKLLHSGDVLINSTGTGTAGRVAQIFNIPMPTTVDGHMILLRPTKEIDPLYYGYVIKSYQKKIESLAEGSTGQTEINRQRLQDEIYITFPKDRALQKEIGTFLFQIDEKIKNNSEINNNLLEQVLTLYRNKFVDTANNERAICRADEYFDISIGKTPPRKEPQWFSTNPQDVTWVSISDMGTCGLYISSSSEQLTKQAVERHNVKVVPDNTVLLSFKLTVGRIAITNGEMTTNEAIAHFKTDKKEINEYLYCYLKCFNYQTMGSTSSIATAVNSKIIKGMPFIVPTNDELEEFHGFAAPMFAKIKANQIETNNLTALRNTLLPKLMSGELDVSNIEL